ncbi:hypothetical protein EIK79_07945 [Halocatena pleomorpha]|uniref:Uncharacterized protein n=1 Tax=Halocatena pleomorpha TaxID=1785090 RepID=A0A3P3RCF0_9EURY|nr:hypothetical protein EIK79_07945 [Halocatena pleomorpha]
MPGTDENESATEKSLTDVDFVKGDDGRMYLHIDAPKMTTLVEVNENDIDNIRKTIQEGPKRVRTGTNKRK